MQPTTRVPKSIYKNEGLDPSRFLLLAIRALPPLQMGTFERLGLALASQKQENRVRDVLRL